MSFSLHVLWLEPCKAGDVACISLITIRNAEMSSFMEAVTA